MTFGCQSMVAPLRRVIVKSPEVAFRNQSFIDSQWKQLNFVDRPDYEKAINEHEALTEILRSAGAEVLSLDFDRRTGLDSIYTHDPGIITDAGAILFQTGKELRRGEGPAMEDALRDWGIGILGRIDGKGTAEGGDMVWLDKRTLLVGHGFRTNAAGVAALHSMLNPFEISVFGFHLPYWQGPGDVLHLMSLISLLDEDLAVVYRPIMAVPLYELLVARGIKMVDVAEEEFNTLGCNVLALGPRDVLMVEGNPVTRSRLQEAGCKVREFSGKEIAYKGSGGPTCLTRPLLRA
ncbi:arginine deiminase family protein [bacterium]|nr:arginine deiminase family protein [bacterium]MCI0605943.1 arginine deiminase family protein [bacterium]